MDNVFSLLVLLVLWKCSDSALMFQSTDWPPPPSWTQKAQTARYLAHYADWLVVASRAVALGGMPFGTVESFCDGPIDNSTGNPYLYLSEMSTTYKNLQYDNHVSFTISMAESDYCKNKGWDPELPLCARLTLSGQAVALTGNEAIFAKKALFSRHPSMKTWPVGHGWLPHKLIITNIFLQDFFGPADHVLVEDYFKADPT